MCYVSHVKQFHLHTGGRTDILFGSLDRHTHELWYKKNKEKLDQYRKKGWVLAIVYVYILLACSTLCLVCRIDDLLKFFYCIDCDVGCSYLYVIINFSVFLLPAQYMLHKYQCVITSIHRSVVHYILCKR